jgi:hypothetical protein
MSRHDTMVRGFVKSFVASAEYQLRVVSGETVGLGGYMTLLMPNRLQTKEANRHGAGLVPDRSQELAGRVLACSRNLHRVTKCFVTGIACADAVII